MPTEQRYYSDEEVERLQLALKDHFESEQISYQALANRMYDPTADGVLDDSRRVRVARFLQAKNLKGRKRPKDDTLNAVAKYLGSVPPPGMKETAIALAHFFARDFTMRNDISYLVGHYRAWVSPNKRPERGQAQHAETRDRKCALVWLTCRS